MLLGSYDHPSTDPAVVAAVGAVRRSSSGSLVAVIPAVGGTVRRLTTFAEDLSGGSWSSDGSEIALANNGVGMRHSSDHASNVYAIAPDGSGLRQITRSSVDGYMRISAPEWMPDDRMLVTIGVAPQTAGVATVNDLRLGFVDPSGGEPELLVRVHSVGVPRISKQQVDDREPSSDFELFFRRAHSRLLALAATLIGDRDSARDVVQESMMRAYVAWEQVSGLERPGAWVRRVLINLCTDVARRRSRERAALARSEHEAPMTVLDAVDSELWRSVRRLPRLQRGAVVLHYLDDLSVAEKADVLGVSSGSVKSSLSRARSALAPSLQRLLLGEEAR